MLDSAWATAQHSGAVDYMPHSEARNDAQLYVRLDGLTESIRNMRVAHAECLRFGIVDPDPAHLSPEQLDHEIDLVSTELLASRTVANFMRNTHTQFPDFAPAPSDADYAAITHGTLTPSADDVRDETAVQHEIARFRDYERSLDQTEGAE